MFCHPPQLFSIEFVIPEGADKAGMRNTFFFFMELLTHDKVLGDIYD